MSWNVFFHEIFEAEFNLLTEEVQDEMLAHVSKIEEFGPTLGRPSVDTLKASKHKNMKELRLRVFRITLNLRSRIQNEKPQRDEITINTRTSE